MWTHHQLLKLPFALHHQISRISGKTRHSAKLTQGEDSENRLIYEWPSVFKTWLIVLFVLYLFSCKGHLIHSLGRSRFTEQSQLPTTHFPTANFMNMSTFILHKRHSGGGLILTPWPWRPIRLLWRQRSGPQSSGSSWRKIPSWWLPPGGQKRKHLNISFMTLFKLSGMSTGADQLMVGDNGWSSNLDIIPWRSVQHSAINTAFVESVREITLQQISLVKMMKLSLLPANLHLWRLNVSVISVTSLCPLHVYSKAGKYKLKLPNPTICVLISRFGEVRWWLIWFELEKICWTSLPQC